MSATLPADQKHRQVDLEGVLLFQPSPSRHELPLLAAQSEAGSQCELAKPFTPLLLVVGSCEHNQRGGGTL